MFIRIAVATLALTAAFVTQLTQAAVAAVPGRTVVFANSAGDSTQRKTVDAYCPAGTVVVGGGAALQSTGREVVKFRTLTPFQSVVDGRFGYKAIAEELRPFSGAWSIAARAICALRPSGYEIRSVTVAANSTSPKTAGVACSPGRVALAPGGTVRGPGVTPEITLRGTLVNSARNGAFAIGEEVTGGFSGNWDMIARVVCADRPAGYAVVERDASSAGQDDSAAQATCPSGTTVHGTGGLIIPQTAGDTHLYFFSSIEPNMTAVRAHRSTPGQTGTWTLRAQVTCAT